MATTMKKTVCVFACALLFSAAAFAADIQGGFFVNGGFSAGARSFAVIGIALKFGK